MKKSLWLLPLLFSASAFGQALPVFNNVSAPLLSTPGAYALAGGGATAANMGSFAPAAGAGAAVLVGAGALAVGTAVGYGLFGLVLGDGDAGVAVPLTGDPENGVPAPPADASQAATTGVVGASCSASYNGLHSSMAAACAAFEAASFPGMRNNGWTPTLTGYSGSVPAACTSQQLGDCYYTLYSGGAQQNYSIYGSGSLGTVQTTCPAGYVLSGSMCNLTNARVAQPDNRNDVGRSGDGFIYPTDADSASPVLPKGQISTTNSPNDTWAVAGRSSSGNPLLVKVRAVPGGGSQVDIAEQVQDANNNSFVRNRHLDIGPDAKVVSDSQTMGPASLTVDPATQTATQNNSTTTTPYSNPELQQQPITFPSDYARQGEAAVAANAMTNALLAPSAAPGDPVLPDGAQFDDAFFKNTFDGLKGWTVPNHVSSCPQPGFDWNGSSYTISTHCQLWIDHQSAIAAAMLVVWSIAALFIVLRA